MIINNCVRSISKPYKCARKWKMQTARKHKNHKTITKPIVSKLQQF